MTKRFGNKNISSLDVGELNWASLANLNSVEKAEAVKQLEPFRSHHVLPQLMALLASEQFKLFRTDDGKFSFRQSLLYWAEKAEAGQLRFITNRAEITKPALVGIMAYLRYPTRGDLLPSEAKQISYEWLRYAHCVPLLLSAFKQYRNVKYMDWDLSDPKLEICTDPKNYQLFLKVGYQHEWTTSELVEIRDSIRTYKSGARAGTMRSLNSTYSPSAVGDPKFNELPNNLKLMLIQTWVYQVCNHTDFGIYDITNFDNLPTALVESDALEPQKPIRKDLISAAEVQDRFAF